MKLINVDALIGEFDPERQLFHLTASERVFCNTYEDGVALYDWVMDCLSNFFGNRKGYWITDYSKIIIDVSLTARYGDAMKHLIDRFIFPGGIARYGLDITRITARISHETKLGGNPNLFVTKAEALAYIDSLRLESRLPCSPAPKT